jgi:hypothetical protein
LKMMTLPFPMVGYGVGSAQGVPGG